MRISQRRIRHADSFLKGVDNQANFYVGLIGLQDFQIKLQKIGLSPNAVIGEQVLPTIIGPITRFNSNGKQIIRRDLPKEIAYREAEINIFGRGEYRTVYIPYERYQREPIPAPCIELTVVNGADNNPILVSKLLNNHTNNYGVIKHIINLFLEIFGECEILQENLLPAFNVPITRLNWSVLPTGNYPWQVLQPTIQGVINVVNQQRRNIVQRRFQVVSEFNPNFVAVGNAGFRGYVVFGFANKNFFVLESIYSGHATYILGANWPQLSQLTKEEILNQNLHLNRFIHNDQWEHQVRNLLK